MFMWACGAAGKPALENRRLTATLTYNAVFTLEGKLREGLVRSFNTGLLSGIVESDGAHASGRRASEKRGRPKVYPGRDEEEGEAPPPDEASTTRTGRAKQRREEKKAIASGQVRDPVYGYPYPDSRRIVFTARRRSGQAGKGATSTRVGVGKAETPDVVEPFIQRYVAIPESVLATDMGPAFKRIGKRFGLHLQVNHSETMVGPEGQHVNQSEGFTARQDRAEKGIYLNVEPKYLLDYAVETAFREDHRRLPPGKVADRVAFHAMNVGPSQWWANFSKGHHRDHEKVYPKPLPAPASGPKKGKLPYSKVSGRPPR